MGSKDRTNNMDTFYIFRIGTFRVFRVFEKKIAQSLQPNGI